MIRRAAIVAWVVSALVLVAHGQPDDSAKALKSADAKRALSEFDKVLVRARDAFDKDIAAAHKKLLADLGSAQEKAARANDLEEAVRIRDVRKGYEDGVAPAPKDGKVQIISAFYGQNVSWLDVTDKARQAAKGKARWSAAVSTKDWGDPAPGFSGQRTLLIRYSVGGRVQFKAAYEGGQVEIP